MTEPPVLTTARLRLEALTEADVPALAAILADPDVTKNITADGSTPERCRESAAARIARHNRAWAERGYGVLAVKTAGVEAIPDGTFIGWCGFAPPDIGDDPEILYGYAPRAWGRGLAKEAATAAIRWLFEATAAGGVSAVIFGRLNPVSVALVGRLGLVKVGTMSMVDFLPDLALARAVLDYEIWRMGHGATRVPLVLLFEAPHKGGQIATLDLGHAVDDVERAFCDAARSRREYAGVARSELEARVKSAFRSGMSEPHLDWYHLKREDWLAM